MAKVQAVPMKKKIEQVLHMIGGAGENSYATNSRLQEKAILRTKPIVEKTILDIINNKCPQTMVIADLGCSAGPNTLHVITEIIDIVSLHCRKNGSISPEIQFFLNDLPTNDINNIFQSLDEFERKLNDRNNNISSHYIAGVPGTFYGRLFPKNTVHFFHSSYCLMWLSQVPEVLLQGSKFDVPMNKGNIYVSETSPLKVVKAYEEQYQRDLSTFLSARFTELSLGGRMVLTFLGRKKKHLQGGELGQLHSLLADALNSIVEEGILLRHKLDSFYIPVHTPSMEEVKAVIDNQGLFDIDYFETFESNWDPLDDSEDDTVLDYQLSGKNTAKCIRAVTEPIITRHFGVSDTTIMDELFSRYANNVSTHLKKEKTKHHVFVIAQKKTD